MIRKVRKWVSKKPSSFEERMNAQPDTFDIIQTQYTTEHQNHPIEVLDHLPGDSDVIVRRNERFESIEIVPKEPGDLSFEEQETLDFLDSAIDDDADDDAFVEDETGESKEENHEEIICKEDTNNCGSKSSSQSDNWSLEARERSSGRLKLMQKNIYLPDTNGNDVTLNDVTPDLPDPDYPGSESDASDITIEESPIIDEPKSIVTSQPTNESELLPNDQTDDAEPKENAPAKILRGTSFNLPQGRSETQMIEQEKEVSEEKPENIEPVLNGQKIPDKKLENDNVENLEPETQKHEPKSTDNSIKSESSNTKEAVTINIHQNNKMPFFKVTGFSRYGDGNNNYPIMTSFKSATQDGDLILLTRNKPVNNLVKKFETMASSTS